MTTSSDSLRGDRLLVAALLAAVLAVSAMLMRPPSAGAHASAQQVTPADGATVEQLPGEVRVQFTAPVKATDDDALQVFGPDRNAVDEGAVQSSSDGTTVVQPLRAAEGAPSGTYAMAWRVVSADGHTITGTATFAVGAAGDGQEGGGGEGSEGGGGSAALEQVLEATSRDPVAQAVWYVSRFATFLGLLGAVGGIFFATVAAPGWRPRWIGRMLALLGLGLAGAFVSDAALTGGTSLVDAFSVDRLAAESRNPYGRGALVTGALALLAASLLPLVRTDGPGPPPRAARIGCLLAFVLLGASLSLTGHAVSSSPVVVRLPLDMVHVLAASVWLGGLLQLWFLVPTAAERVAWIERFSTMAFACVLLLLATGVYAALSELSMAQLFDTRYGHLVLGKLLLYLATMPLAALNKTTLVPAMKALPQRAGGLLRQYVYRELGLVVLIVALTAWLTGTDPAAG